MEFPFDVNNVLPFEITILNGDYQVLNPGQRTRISYVSLKFVKKLYDLLYSATDKLTSIIDAIGEASYKVNKL